MNKLLIPIPILLVTLILTSCDNEPEHGTEKSILNNIDGNVADIANKVDKESEEEKSILREQNTILYNIDKNIVILNKQIADLNSKVKPS
jgi:hypothetical protein